MLRPGMLRPGISRAFRLAVRGRSRVRAEVDEELAHHLALSIEHLEHAGLDRDAARAEALRRLGAGSLDAVHRRLYDTAKHREERMRTREWIGTVSQDVRHTVREMRRAPALAVIAILTFALGIGANATMFGLLDRLLLQPPAHVRAPDEVVHVLARWRSPEGDATQPSLSYPAYEDLRDHLRSLAGVATASYPVDVPLGRGVGALKATAELVSGSYFPVLGVRPHLGRLLVPDDDAAGTPVAVIGYGLWRRQYGADRAIVGRVVALGDRTYTIVGVAPDGFTGLGLSAIDLWIPMHAAGPLQPMGPRWATTRTASWLVVIGRLRPGATIAAVAAEAEATLRSTDPQWWGWELTGSHMGGETLADLRRSDHQAAARVATLLTGVSALVLLIACANVANLLLARGLRRRREVALRIALGISRHRLVRQLLVEGLLLAVAGGLAALLVVRWATALLGATLLAGVTVGASPVDGRVLAFTAAATVLVGLLAAVLPATQSSAADPAATLRSATRQGARHRTPGRTALLVLQAALAALLLAGTGLFVRSLRNVDAVPLGLDLDHVLLATMELRRSGYGAADADAIYREMAERLRRLPGVQSASVSLTVPFFAAYGGRVYLPGRDSTPRLPGFSGPFSNAVDEAFFATLGTRLLDGRPFTAAETAPPVDATPRAPAAVIVNASMARLFWPGQRAVGQCLKVGADTAPCTPVVGVAENARRQSATNEGEMLQYYVPLPRAASEPRRTLTVRIAGNDPTRYIERVRRVMRTTRPNLPYADVRPLSRLLGDERRPWQLGATMFGVFGALAIVLAAIGLYGVVAYAVAQRAHEMGVRLALGARRATVARLVLAQSVRVVALGTLLGLVATLAAAPLVAPLLYHVSPRDPVVFALVAAVLLATAVAAALVPSVRATRVDPIEVLRRE